MNPIIAFSGTFAFFTIAQSQTKKSKRTTKPKHENRHEMTANKHDRKEGRSANSRFAKAGLTCFFDSEVLNSSFVHLMKFSAKNPRLRKAANR